MSDEPQEIFPYSAVAPDRPTSYIKDFRPRYEDPAVESEEDSEQYGGLTVENVTPDGEIVEEVDPKGDTVTESAASSKTTEGFPTAPAPVATEKPADAGTDGSRSKQGKGSTPSS
ncbi:MULTISPECIES: hypothetical protein [Streptomyces]|uniref:hypothetical protein n=1 Tax=Streptomyces TaxID=1883 RepID=UPI0036661413